MSNKTGYLKQKATGDTIIPKTSSAAVYDAAKGQALSATLVDTPLKDTLGYPSFSTVTAYSEGDIVYYANKLYKCKAGGHAAGAWVDADFEETDIKTEIAIATDADNTPTENSTKLVKSGGVWSWVTGLIATVKEWAEELFAKKDGYYSQLTAGSAENLVGQTVDKDAYLIRPTATSDEATNEVANGVASVLGMEGNSCVWNQLYPSPSTPKQAVHQNSFYEVATNVNNGRRTYAIFFELDGDVPSSLMNTYSPFNTTGYSELIFTRNGNYFTLIATGSPIGGSILIRFVDSTVGVQYIVKNIQIFDLTLLGIDNLTTTAQVKAWLAQHPGTKPYYAYNAGTILSAQTLGIKTYGQNLLNPTTKQAKLIPYTWENNSNVYTIKNVPSGATATFTPDATGVAETVDISGGSLDITSYGSGILELSAATADTYVCMKWNEDKDDDVVPYEEHTQDFDVRKVYGKVSGAGEYVQCYPNGMRSAGSVHDTLTASEAVVKIGSVNLGSLTWTRNSVTVANVYRTVTSNIPNIKQTFYRQLLCSKYPFAGGINSQSNMPDKSIDNNQLVTGVIDILIKDSNYPSATTTTTQFKEAMNGVMLNYERATPITYTDLIYRDGGIDRPLADVLMNIEVNNWSMEEQLMTPYDENGNPTSIPATISTIYGMDAVEQIDTLNKTCYFAKDVKDNLQALLNCINTNCAETLGGTFSIGDPTQEDSKVFTFTFTENTEPDVEPTNEGE